MRKLSLIVGMLLLLQLTTAHAYIGPGLAVGTVAIVLGAGIAIHGINSWKRELIGRRKSEVAENTLSKFYEARDVIKWARFPGGYDHEGRSRPRSENESEAEARYRDSVYVPVERLHKEGEFFASLEANKYTFVAYLGRKRKSTSPILRLSEYESSHLRKLSSARTRRGAALLFLLTRITTRNGDLISTVRRVGVMKFRRMLTRS